MAVPIISLGAVYLAGAVFAALQYARVVARGLAGQHATRPLAQADLAMLLLTAPLCALVVYLGAFGPGARLETVSGKPVEVRSATRTVYMPDGRAFRYECWKDRGRGSFGTCPAEARWDALPRWPNVQRVEMQVSGGDIEALTMDGAVIVGPEEAEADRRVTRILMLLVGPLLALWVVLSIRGRLRLLLE